MTTIDLIHQELSKFHELTVSQIYKKLAGQPGISNSKSVSNALMRLKQVGRAANMFDADRGLWVWRVVKDVELAYPQSECQSAEMASDVAEIEAVTEECSATDKESLTVETTTPEPVSVDVKVPHKQPMTVQEVTDNYPYNILEPHMFFAYCAGISMAEKHHGIGQ